MTPLRTKCMTVLAFALTLALTLGMTSSAFAQDDRAASRRVVLSGVISDVATTADGVVLTLDRGERDEDPADDVTIQLTADTRISPPGVEPAVDVRARAVAMAPADEGGAFTALVLVLKGRPQPPQRPLQACGTITALPASGRDGDWTISVPDVADYTFAVSAQTRITPRDVEPAIGMRSCFLARPTDAGWAAQNVVLKPARDGQGGGRDTVELNGTVTGLPADRSGDYVLTIQGADAAHDVLVTPDTEVEGDLADGVRVAVRALRSTDAAGNEVLTAQKIRVVGRPSTPGRGHSQAPVRVEGVVTEVAADGTSWSIAHEGTTTVVTIGDETHIVGLAAGASPLDREVEGRALAQPDGTLLAKTLRVKRN